MEIGTLELVHVTFSTRSGQNVCEEEVADIGVSCFQRESLKEQIVVYLFAATVVVLVGVGMVRARATR